MTITVTPGKTFANDETVTIAKLNQLGEPTIATTGGIGTSDLSAGAVTAAKTTPGAYFYGTGHLSGTVYEITLPLNPASLVDGLEVWFKADADSPAAASAWLVGLGSSAAVTKNGAIPLELRDIRANQIVGLRYSTTGSGSWCMISTNGHRATDYIVSTGSANAYAIDPMNGTAASYKTYGDLTGRLLFFKANFANTGAATLTINGMSPGIPILKHSAVALDANDILSGQVVGVVYDGSNLQMVTGLGNKPQDNAMNASTVGFSMVADCSGGSTTTISITADAAVLKDATTGKTIRHETISLTNTITNTGANGADTAINATGWYSVWLISDGTTVASLLHSGVTDPSPLPSGYTYKALVGLIRITFSGSATVSYSQRMVGRRMFTAQQNIFTATAGIAAWTSILTSYTSQWTAAVPAQAKLVRLQLGTSTTNTGGIAVSPKGTDTDVIGLAVGAGTGVTALLGTTNSAPVEIPQDTSANRIWFKMASTGADYRMDVVGWEL